MPDGSTHDAKAQILQNYFLGKDEQWLFNKTFAEKVHTYDPMRVKTFKHWKPNIPDESMPTAKAIITTAAIAYNWLCDIIETENVTIRKHLLYNFDTYIPIRCAIDELLGRGLMTDAQAIHIAEKHNPDTQVPPWQGSIVDITADIMNCTFWNESKSKLDPVTHLCTKALPQRCQIRNLQQIITNYSRQSDRTYMFMLQTLLCSLIGGYSHCAYAPNTRVRHIILKRLWFSPPSRTQIQTWVFSSFQNLLFYVVKETLVYFLKLIPALENVIRKTYRWDSFEQSVTQAMDKMRMMVEENATLNNSIQKWFDGVEDHLSSISKSQLQNLYRAQRLSFSQAIVSTCNRQDESNGIVDYYSQFSRDNRKLIREMAKRETNMEVCIKWLTYFNVSTDTIEMLLNAEKHYQQQSIRNEVRKTLKNISRHDFEAIRCLFQTTHQTHEEIKIFDLPQHYVEKQLVALRRRYGIAKEEPLPEYVGIIYACLNCHTVKAFISKSTSKNVRDACGHCKVIVDDFTLKIYCGNKKSTSTTKKRKQVTDARAAKREWKNKRKNLEAETCENTEILQICLTGKLLEYHGQLYLFCPECGLPSVYQHEGHSDGWKCAMCRQNTTQVVGGQMTCGICELSTSKWEVLEVNDANKKFIPVCDSCEKPWMRDIHNSCYTIEYLKEKILNVP